MPSTHTFIPYIAFRPSASGNWPVCTCTTYPFALKLSKHWWYDNGRLLATEHVSPTMQQRHIRHQALGVVVLRGRQHQFNRTLLHQLSVIHH